jgi:hypothetical protein
VPAHEQDDKHDDHDDHDGSEAEKHGYSSRVCGAKAGASSGLSPAGAADWRGPGPRYWRDPRAPPPQLLLEDVFDFLAGLLEVALGLVAVAFGFERLVAGGLPGAFLELALGGPG